MFARPLALALSLALIACDEPLPWAEVAGLAVLTLEGQQLVLDTGNGGKQMVSSRGAASIDWHSDCRFFGDEVQVMLLNDVLRERGGFSIFTVDTRNTSAREKPNVFADIPERFSGSCELSYETTHAEDRHEAEISVEACTLTRVIGEPIEARIDAFLSARNCNVVGD